MPFSDHLNRGRAVRDSQTSFPALIVGHRWSSSNTASTRTSSSHSGVGSFADQRALELSHAGEDVE